MENSTYLSCDGIPWQATTVCFSLNFKDKMLAGAQEPYMNHQRLSKKLTEEAVYMIYFILVLVGLVILGSSITAYEFFFQHKEKKIEDATKRRIFKEKKSSEHHDFLEACKPFFKCFCLVKNGSHILITASSESYINCFDGLRFLLNATVTFGHITLLYFTTVRNFSELQYLVDFKASCFLISGGIVVDAFFVMSGYLNAKSFFDQYSRKNGNISWFNFYIKRYMRLTPVYMSVLGFYTTLFSYTGYGKIWPTFATNPPCRKDWWRHLLYISNFEDATKMCMPWCWYLATEMQFYIISPLFMISLIRWPRLGFAMILSCISGSSIISSVLTYQHNLIDVASRLQLHIHDSDYGFSKYWEYFDIIHMKPYARITPYLVAILLAYYLRKKNLNKETIRNNRMTLCCGWIVTIIFMWVCFFALHKREEILMVTALYNGAKELMFSCGFAWIMYLLLTGQLESLNRFLSWKFFRPFSRLNYCAYLIHNIVLYWILLQADKLEDFSFVYLIWLNVSVFGITYVLAFITMLLCELPASNLVDWCTTKKEEKISRKEEKVIHLE